MLNDLSLFLDDDKRADIVNRLNNKRVEQALPAECELAALWLFRNTSEFEVEPHWLSGGRKPDAYTEGLISSRPVLIEVAAVADNSISGEAQMDHCANQLISVANEARKDTGSYLYFTFRETREVIGSLSARGIAAPKNYVPSVHAKKLLTDWICSGAWEDSPLALDDLGLSAIIVRKDWKAPRWHNFHTSRPPRVYSETDNPIYEVLGKKCKQLEFAPDGVWRVILLMEAGSETISSVVTRKFHSGVERYADGETIIRKFLHDKRGRVDAVVVVVPVKHYGNSILNLGSEKKSEWKFRVFGESNAENVELKSSLTDLIADLPGPALSGYNARSLIRQGALKVDSRGWCLPTIISWEEGRMSYKMSCRAFQDFLAGRIDEDLFRRLIGEKEEGPSLGRFLLQGYTISDVQLEKGGLDVDDDYLVFDLQQDAAAKVFR